MEWLDPLLAGGNLIEAPLEDVIPQAVAFLTTHRLPARNPHLSRYERTPIAARDILESLRFLSPLIKNMSTRYLFAETTRPGWTLQIDNRAGGRMDVGLAAGLTKALQTRCIGWNSQDHTLSPQPDGQLAGYAGAANFYVYQNGGLVRSIDCVFDGTWRFAQYGTPFAFEHVVRYTARKRRDRLTREMVKEYVQAFDLKPWLNDFYRVTPDVPAHGIRFISEDPAMNAWLDPVGIR